MRSILTGVPSRPGGTYVYVIEGGHGRVKIGRSVNPAARLAQLATASAFPLQYAFIGRAARNAGAIERAAHARLVRHRRHGEWFDCSAEEAITAVTESARRLGAVVTAADPATVPPRLASAPHGAVLTRALMGLAAGAGATIAAAAAALLLATIAHAAPRTRGEIVGFYAALSAWTDTCTAKDEAAPREKLLTLGAAALAAGIDIESPEFKRDAAARIRNLTAGISFVGKDRWCQQARQQTEADYQALRSK